MFCLYICVCFVHHFTNACYCIFQALDKMEKEWESVTFEIMPYKETGTYILRSSDDTSQLLDDHIVMTQSMSFSPYKKPFEERINNWESKLTTTQVYNILGKPFIQQKQPYNQAFKSHIHFLVFVFFWNVNLIWQKVFRNLYIWWRTFAYRFT